MKTLNYDQREWLKHIVEIEFIPDVYMEKGEYTGNILMRIDEVLRNGWYEERSVGIVTDDIFWLNDIKRVYIEWKKLG